MLVAMSSSSNKGELTHLCYRSTRTTAVRERVVNIDRSDLAGSAKQMASAIATAVDDMSGASAGEKSVTEKSGIVSEPGSKFAWSLAEGFMSLITSCSLGDNPQNLSRAISDEVHYTPPKGESESNYYAAAKSSRLSVVKEGSVESSWEEKTDLDSSGHNTEEDVAVTMPPPVFRRLKLRKKAAARK